MPISDRSLSVIASTSDPDPIPPWYSIQPFVVAIQTTSFVKPESSAVAIMYASPSLTCSSVPANTFPSFMTVMCAEGLSTRYITVPEI